MSPDNQGIPVFVHLVTNPRHDIATTIELFRGVFESLGVLIFGSVALGLAAGVLMLILRHRRKAPPIPEEERRIGWMRQPAAAPSDSHPAPETQIVPLSLVGHAGFEPTTSSPPD